MKAGTYGVTREDVERVARDQIGQLVRCGVLNENIEDYPFYDQSKGVGRTDDFNNTYNQEVALKAAQESIVLLKNDKNVLPSIRMPLYMSQVPCRSRALRPLTR